MKREKVIEKIMRDLGYPPGWTWYVNDVLDRKVPGMEELDLETVKTIEAYIKVDIGR